jgi:uracil-DNA glycosylase
MIESETRAHAASLLVWYREMGVDAVVGVAPVDWLSIGDRPLGAAARAGIAEALGDVAPTLAPAPASTPAPPPRSPPATALVPAVEQRPTPAARPSLLPPAPAPATRQFSAAAPDEAVMAARTAARSAKSLEDLETTLNGFNGCGLKATAKNLCFYRGAKTARIMMIGEAPGRDEDFEGKPFVGRAGQLLDKMLASIGLSDADVHITNIVYWRPPGNRTPTPQEAQVCRPFLERQIELVAPDMIVLLGGAAAKHVLDVQDGIMRLRGKWRDLDIAGRKLRALATLHPAFLLRSPANKRQAWQDLLRLKAALNGKT